jgi:hypothetical protein
LGFGAAWLTYKLFSQSQNIHPDFLSIGASGLSISKKADFVLAFCGDDDEDVRRVYENFKRNNKGATLSPMTDAYTSRVALACAIEIKEAGGKATEAEMQLAVYHAAMLWKLRELINMRRERPMNEEEVESLVPSVVGWTVIGHKWSLYISSLLPDNSIVRHTYPPSGSLLIGTNILLPDVPRPFRRTRC